MPRPANLRPFPEDFSSVLAIVAHPDDLEYGAAGAIARWRSEGKDVAYVCISSGEAGIEGTPPEVAGPVREAEQRASAAVVGVTDVTFLRYPDSKITNSAQLRDDLGEVIGNWKPEGILTLNFRSHWASGGANTPDHIEAGEAVLAAARTAAAAAGPGGGPRWLAINDSPRPTHAVEMTAFSDVAVAALREHRAYLAGLGGESWSVNHLLGNVRRGGKALAGAAPGTLAVECELVPLR